LIVLISLFVNLSPLTRSPFLKSFFFPCFSLLSFFSEPNLVQECDTVVVVSRLFLSERLSGLGLFLFLIKSPCPAGVGLTCAQGIFPFYLSGFPLLFWRSPVAAAVPFHSRDLRCFFSPIGVKLLPNIRSLVWLLFGVTFPPFFVVGDIFIPLCSPAPHDLFLRRCGSRICSTHLSTA